MHPRRILLIVSLLAGCAASNEHTRKNMHAREWTGSTFEYEVHVREWYDQEGCDQREITLRPLNKTHITVVVGYVKAIDRWCDDHIDDWVFRDSHDRERISRSKLEDDVMNAYYVVRRVD